MYEERYTKYCSVSHRRIPHRVETEIRHHKAEVEVFEDIDYVEKLCSADRPAFCVDALDVTGSYRHGLREEGDQSE